MRIPVGANQDNVFRRETKGQDRDSTRRPPAGDGPPHRRSRAPARYARRASSDELQLRKPADLNSNRYSVRQRDACPDPPHEKAIVIYAPELADYLRS